MGDVLVLCYHAVSPTWPADISVTPEALRAQLASLVDRGYRGATFSDAVAGRGPEKALVVTFDDAFASVPALGKPVLDSLGLVGTMYAVSSFAGSGRPLEWDGIDHWAGGPHEHELAGMDWAALRGLCDAGWEVGAHTVTHPRLTTVDDATLARELRESREAVESALDHPCPSIAYPYGDVDARVVAAARAAGFENGAALPAVMHDDRPLEWPRVGVWFGDDMRRFRIKVSPVVRGLRRRLGR